MQRRLIFDKDDAKRAREDGCGRALSNPNCAEWRERAMGYANALRPGKTLSADLLIDAVGLPPEGCENTIGAVFGLLIRSGAFVKIGRVAGTRPESHGRSSNLLMRVGYSHPEEGR